MPVIPRRPWLPRRLRALFPSTFQKHRAGQPLTSSLQADPARPSQPGQGRYTIAALLNVTTEPNGRTITFDGFQTGHDLAVASPANGSPLLLLTVTSPDLPSACERAFDIGNHQAADDRGTEWPADLRSLSVGDVLHVTDPSGIWHYLAVAGTGFTPIDPPSRTTFVALIGTTATSRA
ncbi:hypothetical protein ACWC5I_05065 [Kitasatospora sp. NPDC001574]